MRILIALLITSASLNAHALSCAHTGLADRDSEAHLKYVFENADYIAVATVVSSKRVEAEIPYDTYDVVELKPIENIKGKMEPKHVHHAGDPWTGKFTAKKQYLVAFKKSDSKDANSDSGLCDGPFVIEREKANKYLKKLRELARKTKP